MSTWRLRIKNSLEKHAGISWYWTSESLSNNPLGQRKGLWLTSAKVILNANVFHAFLLLIFETDTIVSLICQLCPLCLLPCSCLTCHSIICLPPFYVGLDCLPPAEEEVSQHQEPNNVCNTTISCVSFLQAMVQPAVGSKTNYSSCYSLS